MTGTAEIASMLGLVVALVGFKLAIDQISDARDAAQAAAEAIESSQQSFAKNQILTTIPSMQSLEQDIDLAADAGQVDLVVRLLNRWRQQAAEIQGILGEDAEQGLTEALASAINQAAIVKGAVMKRVVKPLEASEIARDAIANAMNMLNNHASRIRTFSLDLGEPS